MNKIEVKEVLDYLSYNYNTFNVTEGLFKMWLDELQQYDKEDVMDKIKKMIASGNYKVTAPQLVTITSGLTKTDKKIDWNKTVTFCPICNKAFQCDNTMYSKIIEYWGVVMCFLLSFTPPQAVLQAPLFEWTEST